MKKTYLLILLVLSVFLLAACGVSDSGNTDITQNTAEAENVNPENILVKSVLGLNEQIYLSLEKPESGSYSIFYKSAADSEYTPVDKELIMEEENSCTCYIIGLKKGNYTIKIEQGEGDNFSRATINSIDVEKQDRSGYAHFNREEGIGGYNNDGTVKDGAKIIYLTNENKNTVTLDINGTTYTGLVEILQANQHMAEPLIIRVLDRITTNQWTEAESDPRELDYSTISDDYFSTIFSKEYGENLAGLPIIIYASSANKRYEFVTEADGISLLQIAEEKDYDNTCSMNVFDVENASNITIEGVGVNAGFYQFGIAFHYSDSIEVRNLTIEHYPVDGIGFYAFGDVTLHGWYWIHNNTFKPGYNSWGTTDSDGDESIDLADVRNVTFSYNKFDSTGKTMLLGGWEYDACLNITFHHNYYVDATQRLPLSRNSNIHNYNNYYENCGRGLSPRTSTYVFGEANYFKNIGNAYYISGTETWGAIKSWNEIYENSGGISKVTTVTSRDEIIENTCSPDEKTDYSKFDTDQALFYYDAENKCSDVELMHKAEELPDFVKVYTGVGVLVRLELAD